MSVDNQWQKLEIKCALPLIGTKFAQHGLGGQDLPIDITVMVCHRGSNNFDRWYGCQVVSDDIKVPDARVTLSRMVKPEANSRRWRPTGVVVPGMCCLSSVRSTSPLQRTNSSSTLVGPKPSPTMKWPSLTPRSHIACSPLCPSPCIDASG